MTAISCGLDFGTSNSTLGLVQADGTPWLLPLEAGSATLPSVVFFSFDDDRTYFGRAAIREYVSGADGRMMRAIKSVLGTSLFEETTRLKMLTKSFSEIVGLFLAQMKARAEETAGREIEHVVLGRPVQFVDGDESADRTAQLQLETAARAQGFQHIEFQFEPIAAALDYERTVGAEELTLVVDIGGGTSDFTLIRVSPDRAKAAERGTDILATRGVHVGGTDFDRLLSLAAVMPELGYRTMTQDGKRPLPSAPYVDLATWHRINRLYTQKTLSELKSTRREAVYPERVDQMISVVTGRLGHRLAGAVEDAKISLTENERTDFHFAFDDVELHTALTRAVLTDAIRSATNRIDETIDRMLVEAGLAADRVQTIMLTGGSTQIPAIMSGLRARFPEANFIQSDAFGAVGLGLTLDAARKF